MGTSLKNTVNNLVAVCLLFCYAFLQDIPLKALTFDEGKTLDLNAYMTLKDLTVFSLSCL